MRRAAAALALLALAACGGPADFTLSNLAGPTNIAAIDAAAACRNDEALRLTSTEMASANPPRRLMAHFTQAAIYADLGRQGDANRVLAAAAADPEMNPQATPRPEFDEPAGALLTAIREKRTEATGSATC